MKTILVVDDERNIVELLRLYLEKEGFAVAVAFDGEEALTLHARHEPEARAAGPRPSPRGDGDRS